MRTILDSNVVLDVFERRDSFVAWSERWMKNSFGVGELVFNAVILAETCAGFRDESDALEAFASIGAVFEDIPIRAGYGAGVAQRIYRMRGGERARVLPDFMIGAHALAEGHRLLTRDAARYRSYFPALEIIAPDTHP